MNKQNFKNGNAMFPISTDALDFMQEQTLLVAQLTALAGSRVIIRKPTSGQDGLCIFDGELLPLTGVATGTHIQIAETTTDIIARGTTYKDARVVRQAVYTDGDGESVETFEVLDTMLTLKNSIANLNSALESEKSMRAQHDVPKGTIIDWYGACMCSQVPYGWIPCGAFFKRANGQFNPGGNDGYLEMEKWKSKYPDISIEANGVSMNEKAIFISYCNGVSIPNLTDRFIVQAGGSYSLGETGGQKQVTLKASDCALPEHRHTVLRAKSGGREIGDYCFGSPAHSSGLRAEYCEKLSDSTPQYEAIGTTKIDSATTSHENRPPFFALYKLIKVI